MHACALVLLAVASSRQWVGLAGLEDSLDLPESAVELSWRSLAEVGNLSSASVLHVLEKTIDAGPPPPGTAGLMIGPGPGVSVELVPLRW